MAIGSQKAGGIFSTGLEQAVNFAPPVPPHIATFVMDSLSILDTRSRHNDTDYVYLAATVGANDPVYATRPLGDLNNGTHGVALSVEVDIPDDETIVVFSYVVVNSGHGGSGARERAAQSALSTIGKEIIAHGAVAAGAIVVGTILVPIVVSALAAVAGILALTEVGLILFADCDGVVAAGALPFRCSDLIARTNAGHHVPDVQAHAGTDSPIGCGSNSRYSTTCHVTTRPAIQTILDLNGEWAGGPFITVHGDTIAIDMSSSHRPAAHGTVFDATHISVNFPDDKSYTGILQAPNIIKWSNNSTWTKVVATTPIIDLNGGWMSGGVLGPRIKVEGNLLSVDMSALNRPNATGNIVNGSTISVSFPDDKTYIGTLQQPDTIRWSNNSTWTKFDRSVIKHLFVLVMENRAFDHLLGAQGITGTDTQTGKPTKAEGIATQSIMVGGVLTNDYASRHYAVSPTAGDKTFKTHDVNHQFPNVLTQLCGEAAGAAFAASGGLHGGNYPPVVAADKRGFAADYAAHSDVDNPGEPMRCFAPGDLPVLTALAKEFVLCDHWFSAMAGPTEPNRMFVHAASSGGWDDSPTNSQYEEIYAEKVAGASGHGIKFDNGTIFDALRRAKVPFRIYAGDQFPQVGLLSGISLFSDVDDFEDFAGDINEPTYNAAYTFIEPKYETISQNAGVPFVNNSQHPANGVAIGETLIKRVYETIRNSPLWNRSMLIVTWDEHGGFFDHVTPPRAARIPAGSPPKDIEGKNHGYMFDQYGPRVPAVVISPWCPQNMIEHRQLEHSVIPATIEQLFGLPPLTVRDAALVGLHTLATLDTMRNVVTPIPDAVTVAEPAGPVPATTTLATNESAPAVATMSGATISPAASDVGVPVVAPLPSSPLNFGDPRLPAALAVAVKAHMEAVPAEADAIRARGFNLKTVDDLTRYHADITPIVAQARTAARQQKLLTRKQGVVAAGPVVAVHEMVKAQVVGA